VTDELARLQRRYERESAARREAETIAERVTSELYAATTELQEANQAIRDFVAVASHDLRGPLTAIIGAATLMRRRWDDLSETQRGEFLGMIERQSGLLERMVDDLLTLSRIEAGAIEPRARAVELRAAIDAAIAGFTETSSIEVTVPADACVVVDPDHLQRILTNYVGNALKYGAPPIGVEVTRGSDGWVEVRVSDNGAGVPDEFVPRLFGKFARADNEATRRQRGTGLGLSIVRGLAQVNGGDTWYEPHEPHGSCFAVRLRAS
jgi:signal transduction histidine kinase